MRHAFSRADCGFIAHACDRAHPQTDRPAPAPASVPAPAPVNVEDLPTLPMSAEQTKLAKSAVKAMLAHKGGFWFATPVDPVALNLPDYFTVVKNPMDLGTRPPLAPGSALSYCAGGRRG